MTERVRNGARYAPVICSLGLHNSRLERAGSKPAAQPDR